MFKNPFSFNGRIRRLEYGLTFIIYVVAYVFVLLLSETEEGIGPIIALVILIPMIWFVWAQGAKRCHDISRSGWMQIVPFYFLFLLFEDGKPGRNEYGSNPKEGVQMDVLESETLDGHLKS